MNLNIPASNIVTHASPDETVDDLGSVHMWLFNLDKTSGLRTAEGGIFSAEELLRTRRLKNQVDRQRFLNRCFYVRQVLGTLTAAGPKHLRFTRGPHGKPRLVVERSSGNPRLRGLRFSISHSENILLMAVAFYRQIGIDIEVVHPELDIRALLFLLSPRYGMNRFGPSPSPFGIASFYHLWTQYEALAKASGRGITQPFQKGTTDSSRWNLYSFRFRYDHKDVAGGLAIDNLVESSNNIQREERNSAA